ncbi:MAG: deoxynucleoside kinase [Oligoflexales bacterium]|nr:deoxynucleoside kinase [Oligoflexales bacterium]
MLIIVEGNIGVGKSTLSRKLAEEYDFRLFEEGADTNADFKQYLSLYYREPSRYALEMQFWLLSTRFRQHQEAIEHIHNTGQCCIMDRSIYGDTVFAKRNYLDGNISRLGYDSYRKHRDVMLRFLMVPQLTIYLDAPSDVCLNRIAMRNRSAEAGIPITYLEGLSSLYKELLVELEERNSTVEIIDWSTFQSVDVVKSRIEGFLTDYRWNGFKHFAGLLLKKSQEIPENKVIN